MAWENHLVSTRPTTPQEVLAILGEDYRLLADTDPFMDLDELTFGTTVHRWMDYDDFPNWRRWGESLNERFGTDFTRDEWKSALAPMKRRTLKDVCALIALRARVPVIEAATVLGKPCVAAGAFLTLRELLRRRNAEVSDLRPSTPIEAFARTHGLPLLQELARLRPNGWPQMKLEWEHHRSRSLTFAMFLGGMAVAMLGGILQWMEYAPAPFILLLGVGPALLGYVAQWFTPDSEITRVEFGKLRTFRDVCEALVAAEGHSARLALSSG